MPRTALWLGALLALAGCASPSPPPAGPPREAAPPTAQEEPREPKARSLARLADTLRDRGHLAEAEHFYRRALAIEFAEGGADADFRARTLAGLGSLLDQRAADDVVNGRRDEASRRYEEALEIWVTLQPASDQLVAQTLANLALLRRARGEQDRARALLERALPLYEKTLAEDDPTVVRVRALMADHGLRPDPPYEAEPPRAVDPDPATVARDLDRQGAGHLDRREYARARPLLERAVAIHERGITAPVELGASLSYLGRTYAGLGERASARRTLERSLALLEPALGKLDPLTLATRASLENMRDAYPANAP